MDEEAEKLDEFQTTRYKSLVARANYLAADRPDIQFACRELSIAMSKPINDDWTKLKRLGRYLEEKPRLVHKYARLSTTRALRTFTDASWAGDKKTRTSTSGGCVILGTHWLKSWSKTQTLIALSSAESELYVAVKAIAETMGIQSMAKDFGLPTEATIMADASAALGIISRKGLGKVRHLDINHLWIQQAAAQRRIKYENVAGTSNPTDLMTKELAAAEIEKYVDMMSAQYAEGRPEIASRVSQDVRKEVQLEINIAEKVRIKAKADISIEENKDDGNNCRNEVKHFRLKKEEEKIKMVIEGEEYLIAGKIDDQRRDGETRSQFITRRFQQIMKENAVTQADREEFRALKMQCEERAGKTKDELPVWGGGCLHNASFNRLQGPTILATVNECTQRSHYSDHVEECT